MNCVSVVLLADDLMVISRVEGAAQRVGVTLKTASDAVGAVSQCAERPVGLLIVDLSARAADAAQIMSEFSTATVDRPPIVAFGPHVHEARLTAATEAGCEEVLSRGQFFAQLDAILGRLVDHPVRDQEALPSDG